MNAKRKLMMIILVLALAGFACGELDIGIEPTGTTEESAPPSVENTPTTEPAPEVITPSEFAQYWVEVEDSRTGVRFEIPCFWTAEIPQPEQDPSGYGSFSVNNFSSDFVASLGNKQAETIWTIGGMKFDFGYTRYSDYGLSADASLDELANAMFANNDESQLTSLTPMSVNGQTALRVDSTSVRGDGRFYLLDYSGEMAVMVAPFPMETDASPDFQAILNSISLSADIPVNNPDLMPTDPPQGMGASCIGVTPSEAPSTEGDSDSTNLEGTLDCAYVSDAEPQLWVMCNVQDSFISRNTQPLLGYMGDLFQIGYWQSEGRSLTREDAMQEIVSSLMPDNTAPMTFTTDTALFPPLFGMPPENMFGPDANIVEVVYSEGWGQDGNGAVLLYFAEDLIGDPYFYGMVFSGTHFDK